MPLPFIHTPGETREDIRAGAEQSFILSYLIIISIIIINIIIIFPACGPRSKVSVRAGVPAEATECCTPRLLSKIRVRLDPTLGHS